MSTNPHLTDDDIEELQRIKAKHLEHRSNDFDHEVQGRHDAWDRKPRLPSDLACVACGGAIEHGDGCVTADGTRGVNEYGEFSADGDERTLRCLDCADG